MKKYLAFVLTFVMIFSIALSAQSAFERAKADVLKELGGAEKPARSTK